MNQQQERNIWIGITQNVLSLILIPLVSNVRFKYDLIPLVSNVRFKYDLIPLVSNVRFKYDLIPLVSNVRFKDDLIPLVSNVRRKVLLCFVFLYHAVFTFQYGEIEEMNVCDNLGDHLVGNVYVKVSAVINVILSAESTTPISPELDVPLW